MAGGNILNGEERAQVAEAIGTAESRTSGEIYCVLARASDGYFYPAAFFVALSIVAVSLPTSWALHHWWVDVAPVTLAAAQMAALLAGLLVLAAFPRLRIHLVPDGLRHRRAHGQAMRQFLAHNIHSTRERTGVLVFVSLAERHAEIVADSGINDRVPQERWDDIVAALTAHAARGDLAQGFVEAVQAVGAELATHFPAGANNPNELGDHLVEI